MGAMVERNLLILDDDELVGAYIKRVAETLALPARVTTTVEAFVDQLHVQSPTDVVLDLKLGLQDGVQVLRILASEGSKAGIILLSGFDDRVLAAARDLGVNLGLNIRHALTKPVRAPALQAALKLDEATATVISPADLEGGIRRGELMLEYQPIIGCQELEVRGVEALVRWSRGGERIPPGAFIPVAEANAELMDLLTMDVVERAVRDWRTLEASGRRTCISINVSAQNLRRLDFPERIASLVDAAAVPASGLKLELTETAAMAEPQASLDTLLRLRLKGFQLSVDDFGTGFTSIAMLRRLPFTELKIDRSFVSDVATSEDALAVARGIVALGRGMGLSTVAEGVETQEVLDVIKSLGTDSAQGFLISRPLSLDRLLVWLVQRHASVPGSVTARLGA
jgi:EAL domain-containing protein (putative c-di-GMP-specific phosphodiesterase class I)/ActR/RegA family two-component response regulator